MAIRSYHTDVDFEIEPIWKNLAPRIQVCLDDHVFWDGEILENKSFQISRLLPIGQKQLLIKFYDKPDHDAYQAIKIKNLRIGKISSPRFIWKGRYLPQYPEPWATQQRKQGIYLESELHNTDYLGWNGTWLLDFTIPIFTWIHQVENLGWIHD